MDVDWCLTCQKHTEGPHAYCSPGCQPEVVEEYSRWSGNDHAGIVAWAADIPPNSPPLPRIHQSPSSSVSSSPLSTISRKSSILDDMYKSWISTQSKVFTLDSHHPPPRRRNPPSFRPRGRVPL